MGGLTALTSPVYSIDATASSSPCSEPIPWAQIGTKAGADYKGDGLSVTPTVMGGGTATGARLRCVFQRLEGEATPEGLWLTSTATNQSNDRFRVVASQVGRVTPCAPSGGASVPASQLVSSLAPPNDAIMPLPNTGNISVDGQTVRFIRPGLVEEYTVSMDGVRQDFIIASPLSTLNPLVVQLSVTGARVERAADGAQLVLEKSGRKIAYSHLRVTDATGKELPARMEVENDSALRTPHSEFSLVVDDTDAVYPVRIDPTFSDANWISISPSLLGVNGGVVAAVVDGSGNLYIGGEFTVVGNVIANHIAKWNGSSWSALGLGVNNYVRGLAVSGGDVYAGGWFTRATNSSGVAVAVNFIAKWNGNSWGALGSGVTGYNAHVNALAMSGSDLYVGGDFTTAGGVGIGRGIARWDGSNWNALGLGLDNEVAALVTSGNALYAGGGFNFATNSGGVSVPVVYIAKWDGSNWSALGGTDRPVFALAVSGNDVYAGGGFTNAGGIAANYIAKWNGSNWSALGFGMNNTVLALAVSGSNVYAGGDFTAAGGNMVNRIAKWNGSSWSTFGSGLISRVSTIAVSGGDLYVGGGFWSTGSETSEGVGITKWDGSKWSTVYPGMDYGVSALAVSGNDLYVGGSFTRAIDSAGATIKLKGIAKWDGSGWSAVGLGINGTVSALAVSGGNLYVGGFFTQATNSNGAIVTANSVAKWNGSSWSALGSGALSIVYALAISGSNVYAGGSFSSMGGVTAHSVAKWNGSSWSALGSGINEGVNNRVNALAVSGSNLYVGGIFTFAGGIEANAIAKWDGSSWSALGSGLAGVSSGLPGLVYALAVSGTNLYVGGGFLIANQNSGIARWDGSNWSTLAGIDGGVRALALSDTDLYAGGAFSTAGTSPANYVARWNGSNWVALGSGMNDWVLALAAAGNNLYAGGNFTIAGGKVSAYVAKAILPDNTLKFITSNSRFGLTNGLFASTLTGPDAANTVIEASTNLEDWIPLATNPLIGGSTYFTDPQPANQPGRFYRARLLP